MSLLDEQVRLALVAAAEALAAAPGALYPLVYVGPLARADALNRAAAEAAAAFGIGCGTWTPHSAPRGPALLVCDSEEIPAALRELPDQVQLIAWGPSAVADLPPGVRDAVRAPGNLVIDPVYASMPAGRAAMAAAAVPVAGTLDEFLAKVSVVVDCTPKKVGAENRERYRAAGVRSIWQGGEKHEVAGYSFVAQVNYAGAVGRDSARVVSCNTTALCRVTHALHRRGLVRRVRAVLLRRATDPWESHRNGMINTAVPETRVPSHQGPDAQTVIPGLDIATLAGAGPYNLSHLHYAMVETTRPVSLEELRDAVRAEPRIAFVRADEGLVALNSVLELMRDLGRPRGDMWEVAVWEDALAADEREVSSSRRRWTAFARLPGPSTIRMRPSPARTRPWGSCPASSLAPPTPHRPRRPGSVPQASKALRSRRSEAAARRRVGYESCDEAACSRPARPRTRPETEQGSACWSSSVAS